MNNAAVDGGVKLIRAQVLGEATPNFVITMSKKHYHVTPRGDGWAVQGTGNERASSLHRTQSEAIGAGRQLAQQAQSELRIHRPDGRIREGWSYGNDPHPPKG